MVCLVDKWNIILVFMICRDGNFVMLIECILSMNRIEYVICMVICWC